MIKLRFPGNKPVVIHPYGGAAPAPDGVLGGVAPSEQRQILKPGYQLNPAVKKRGEGERENFLILKTVPGWLGSLKNERLSKGDRFFHRPYRNCP